MKILKKKIYSFILTSTVLFFSCKNSREIKNDLERQELHGNVKSITENSYYAVEKFGEIVKGEKLIDEIFNRENRYAEFNKSGYLIESNWDFKTMKYKYDQENQLIEEDWFSPKTKMLNQKTVYNFNSNGLIIEDNTYFSENIKSIVQKRKYQYDSEENLIERNSYDVDGKLSFKEINTYKDKKLIESKQYDSDGTLIFSTKYDDEKGNENNEIKNKYIYKKLDSNKNWTERIELENGEPNLIIERKIEYF